jgi:hypothetical protein
METLKIEYRGYVIIESYKLQGWYMTECETMCGQTIDEVKQDLDSLIEEKQMNMKITVYYQGDFGMSINKIEGRLKEFGVSEWAQYKSSPYVKMVPKRKRNVRGLRQSYNPYMLIVAGWDHPDVDDGMRVVESVTDCIVKRSKHLAFDEGWIKDADELLDGYISQDKIEVLADYRASKGFNSYAK